ncbi:MAG: N-acetyltransferase [Alphaproteobacteria bacterium]|nr:N-acetyltransferase [Alphaproteobacteria bacterium]
MILVVRRARPGDAGAIARVHVETWQTTYAGLIPDNYLVRMGREERTGFWTQALARMHHGSHVLVAEAKGVGVVGFSSFGPARANGVPLGSRFTGEIYTLYVLPDYQGRGLGRALLRQAFTSLSARGLDSALIWVLAGNPARFFYERMGGKRAAERIGSFAGADLVELGYGWRDLPR